MGVCYRPPKHDEELADIFYKLLGEVSRSLALVLVGDFNSADVCWKYSTAERKQSLLLTTRGKARPEEGPGCWAQHGRCDRGQSPVSCQVPARPTPAAPVTQLLPPRAVAGAQADPHFGKDLPRQSKSRAAPSCPLPSCHVLCLPSASPPSLSGPSPQERTEGGQS